MNRRSVDTRVSRLLGALWLAGCGGPPAPLDAAGDDGGPRARCVDDVECSDGLFCDGAERCRPGLAGADARGCIGAIDVTPCLAGQSCDEAGARCRTICEASPDADGDGVTAVECGGTDCDDGRADVHPGAMEICDAEGADEDCDPTTFGTRDVDGDGSIDARCCNGSGAARTCGDDCDDLRQGARPGADEVCNGADDDCDDDTDEAVQTSGFVDDDGDLHGDPARAVSACIGAPHFSVLGDDCDDDDPRRSPSLDEVCDLIDNDCDTRVDESARALTWYADADGDGFGSARGGTTVSCAPPAGYSLLPSDCDDHAANVSPVAPERCNGVDDDCNGAADFRLGTGDFEDDDDDGVPDANCGAASADCDDRDPFAFPGADELCDLRDDDCDGRVDEEATSLAWLPDADGDRWGDDSAAPISSCAPIAGRVTRGSDCDDARATVHPGASDGCDGASVDEDCDATTDEDALRIASYADADADGFGSGTPTVACAVPAGRSATPGDCDDTQAATHPGAAEVCTGSADADCDGAAGCADTECAPTVACSGTGIGHLMLVSGPSVATATALRPLDAPVRLRLVDGHGDPVVDAPVRVTAARGAFATPSETRTSLAGEIVATLYVGMRAGAGYDFTFSSAGVADYVFRATALAPATGATDVIVGALDAGLGVALPAPALASRFDVMGVAYLADGTLAVSGRACVMHLDADGALDTLVGVCRSSASATPAGDGGPSAGAVLAGAGPIAYDAAANVLYVADPIAGQLRAAELGAGGRIRTLATGLGNVVDVDVGPDGAAYATHGGGVTRIASGVASVRYAPTRLRTAHAQGLQIDAFSATFGPGQTLVLSMLETCDAQFGPRWGRYFGIAGGPTSYDEPAPLGTAADSGYYGICSDNLPAPTSVPIVHASAFSADFYSAEEGTLSSTDAVSGNMALQRLDARIRAPRQLDAAGGDVVLAAGTRVLRFHAVEDPPLVPTLAPMGAPTSVTAWSEASLITSCPASSCACASGSGPEGTMAWRARVRALDVGGAGGASNYDCTTHEASVGAIVGPSLVTQHFEVGIDSIYRAPLSPTPFSVDVTAPSPGTSIGLPTGGGSGFDTRSFARTGAPISDIAPISDGRFYVAGQLGVYGTAATSGSLPVVYRVELDGSVVPIAGFAGDDVAGGDGGPAIGAPLASSRFGRVVATDEVAGLVFFDDIGVGGATIIRAVDVGTGIVSRYAGGGSSTAEGTHRLSFQLDGHPTHLRVDRRDRSLWVGTDATLVRIDATTGAVTRPYPFTPTCNGTVALTSCRIAAIGNALGGCDVAFEQDGSIDVAGTICLPGCGATNGILHVPSIGPAEVWLGACSGYGHSGDRADARFDEPVYAIGVRPDGVLLASVWLGALSGGAPYVLSIPSDLAAPTDIVVGNTTYPLLPVGSLADGSWLGLQTLNFNRGYSGVTRFY